MGEYAPIRSVVALVVAAGLVLTGIGKLGESSAGRIAVVMGSAAAMDNAADANASNAM